VDVDVGQFDTPHHNPAQVDGATLGAGQVDGTQLRAAEISELESCPPQVSTYEVSHLSKLTAGPADFAVMDFAGRRQPRGPGYALRG
jgi:hypothetical protein